MYALNIVSIFKGIRYNANRNERTQSLQKLVFNNKKRFWKFLIFDIILIGRLIKVHCLINKNL